MIVKIWMALFSLDYCSLVLPHWVIARGALPLDADWRQAIPVYDYILRLS
jgi:hypothetical protein